MLELHDCNNPEMMYYMVRPERHLTGNVLICKSATLEDCPQEVGQV